MNDRQQRITVDGIDPGSMFLFPRLLWSMASALHPPRLLIAVVSVLLISLAGRAWDFLSVPSIAPADITTVAGPGSTSSLPRAVEMSILNSAWERWAPPGQPAPAGPELTADAVLRAMALGYEESRGVGPDGEPMNADERRTQDAVYLAARSEIITLAPHPPWQATRMMIATQFREVVLGAIDLDFARSAVAIRRGVVGVPSLLWRHTPFFSIYLAAVISIIAASGGLMLARMSACEIGKHERLSLHGAFDFGRTRFLRAWLVLVTPPLAVLAVLSLIAIPGLMLSVPWIDIVGAILMGVALLIGLVAALAIIGWTVGLPLLLPPIACEDCDAIDAIQRAYAYVFRRPLHYAGYAAVSVVAIAIGGFVIAFVASTAMSLATTAATALQSHAVLAGHHDLSPFALSPQSTGPIHGGGTGTATATILSVWFGFIAHVVVGYVVALAIHTATMSYLFLRRTCDGQDIEEIWREGLVPGTLAPIPRHMLAPDITTPVSHAVHPDPQEDAA